MSRQRKDTLGNPLPAKCYQKHSIYWCVYRNKWTRLGTSYASAMAAYGRQVQPAAGGFGALVDKALQAHSKLPTRDAKPPAANTMHYNCWKNAVAGLALGAQSGESLRLNGSNRDFYRGLARCFF